MKFPIAAVVAMISLAGVSAVKTDFNFGWEWRRGDGKEWRAVDLPHDFMFESPWSGSANHSQRVFKPLGEAFYKKAFQYDPSRARDASSPSTTATTIRTSSSTSTRRR